MPAAVMLDQRPTAAAPRLRRNPFRLGVASGDPSDDGFVIWTRLAVSPLARDGSGGMPRRRYTIRFQVATDRGFNRVVRDGQTTATPQWGHSARAVIRGLQPGREYWYRWRVQGHLSAVGRAVTTPSPQQDVGRLTLLQLSCAAFHAGYFNVYRHAAQERADLMVHLGDYIYEGAGRDDTFRRVLGPRCETLADYRLRYAQYHADPDLRAAHAAAPWLVTFDDHEVANNYAGLDAGRPPADFAALRARAYQAWFENQPVRWFSRPSGADLRAHRRVEWGELASLHLLDTRQYRSNQPCNLDFGDCPERTSPARTMLGDSQTEWLADSLAGSEKRWDLLAQQVFFGRRYVDEPERQGYLMDAWDGYAHSRGRVLDMLDPALGPAPRNPVVLTGDTHAAWLADIKRDYTATDSPTLGTEVGATSVASSGDGYDSDGRHPFMLDNPHIRFHNALRGYCRLTIERTAMSVAYRVVDTVRSRDTTMWTRAGYVVPDREAQALLVADRAPSSDVARVRRAPDDAAAATLREELG